MKRVLSLALVLLTAGGAQGAFDDLGSGARAPGMADAFTALADDVYALHYNPAGLAQLERPQFGASYSKLYGGLSDGSELGSSQFAYAHPLMRGKQGTLGVGLERFALGSLYSEQALAMSYARRLRLSEDGSQFLSGLNFKYLSRSFSKPPEADASCIGLSCTGGADPVLSGPTRKNVMDADLGFLYRFPRRFQMGLSILHLMSPNIAFSGTDKLDRAYNLALAYKSLWMSLVGEIKMRKAANGNSARDLIIGAERVFPTLDRGQFAVRGGLGVGSDEWRQMTIGGSYRINKIQADYAFLLPLGAVKGQSGSHRVGLTFHFGAPSSEDEISSELLAQAKRLTDKGPDYGYGYSSELKPQDLDDPRLAEVRLLIEQRRYRAAHKLLVDFALKQPLSQPLIRLSNRLDLVAYQFPDLPEPASRFDEVLVSALKRFLHADDRLAMLMASYASSLRPEEARLTRLLGEMEKAVGIMAERLPSGHPRGFIEELLWRVEYAHTRGDTAKVENLLSDILLLEPENATALERLGSLRYLAGRYQEAITAWETALKIESKENELVALKEYLRLAKERAAGKELPGGIAPAAAIPAEPRQEVPTPTEQAKPVAPSAAVPASAPAQKSATPQGDPRDIEALYQKGVEHYSRGEYLQASSMFLRIIQIDPNNEQALKALERIDRRRAKQ